MAGTEPTGNGAPEDRLEDLDPFSFARRPETDPTAKLASGGIVAFPESVIYPRLGPGLNRWSECPSQIMVEFNPSFEARIPAGFKAWESPDQPWDYAKVLDSFAERVQAQKYSRRWNNHWNEPPEPRIKLVDGDTVVGSVPRAGHVAGSAAYQFRIADPYNPMASSRPYDGAVQRCFVLTYTTWTSDDGWTWERVLDVTGADMRLVERIPGWLPSSS